jgi:hypothetical protein
MESIKSSSDKVKELAIQGKFYEINESYGPKRVAKAIEYVTSKLNSLREKQAQGFPILNIPSATPFMLHVIKNSCNNKVRIYLYVPFQKFFIDMFFRIY